MRLKSPISGDVPSIRPSRPEGWSKACYYLAVVGVAVLGLGVGFLFSSSRRAAPRIPLPPDLSKLEAQLRDYITQNVAWVSQAPFDPKRHATLGIIFEANGLWSEARQAFQNVIQLDPGEPLAQLHFAIATQEMGDLDSAIRLFRELVAKFPNFAPGQYWLGDTMLRAGVVAEAEAPFSRLINLVPREWRGPAGLGEVKLRQGKYDEAAKQLDQSVRLDPTAKIAHHLLGLAYRGLGRTEDAERELNLGLNATHYPMSDPWLKNLKQHVRLLPDLFQMAQEHMELGQALNAVQILEGVLKWHQKNPNVLNNLAQAYNESGQPQKAQILLRRVLNEIDSNNVPALSYLSANCLSLGLDDEAMLHAKRAVALAPELALSHVALANAHLAFEHDSDAVAEMEIAFRCDPQNARLQVEMGDVFFRNLNRPDEALTHYERAVKINPAFAPAHGRLLELYTRLGKTNEALQTMNALRKLAPDEKSRAELDKRLIRLNKR